MNKEAGSSANNCIGGWKTHSQIAIIPEDKFVGISKVYRS